MAHFGLLFPPGTSHVTATTTIARELVRRGHRATAFNFLDVEDLVKREGIEFCPLGIRQHPKGSVPRNFETLGRMGGLKFLRFGMKLATAEIINLLEEAPEAMQAAGVTALLVDAGQPAGSTIAEKLGVPFATICNALHSHPDPAVPPPITGWGPATSGIARMGNRITWRLFDWGASPLRRKVNSYRKKWGLRPLRTIYETFSPLLELAQESADFDFPMRRAPPQFHYIGLIHRTYAANMSFPFDRLDGRPLIYASLGTVYDNQMIFQKIAEACANLGLQLVITLGSKGNITSYADLPGSPIIVNYAPQHAVLERTAITICHSGHNTVLDSLAYGVPVVAIPVQTADTGVAARLRHSGAGEWIKLSRLTSARLRTVLSRVLSDRTYKQRAQAMGESLERAGGERRAADLIEQKMGLR